MVIAGLIEVNQLRRLYFWRDVLAEFIGAFFLISVQCAIVLKFDSLTAGTAVQIGLGMGFVLMCMVETFGHFGGGHFNPAVTVGMLVARKIDLLKAGVYIVSQSLSGMCAAGFVYAITPSNHRASLSATMVHDDISPVVGMIIEAWLTAVLIFTIFGSTDSVNKRVSQPSITIGLAVALDIMTGINYTGASMNPARSLGPAVVMGLWDNHWVYWVGPCGGATIASVLYNYVLAKPRDDDEDDDVALPEVNKHDGGNESKL